MNYTGGTMKATVGVLTFHRTEQIVETVKMLLAQTSTLPEPWQAEVLVVDNDPAGSGRDALAALDLPGVRCVVEPTPGISAARNRAVDEAQGSAVLLFTDDDERPHDDWVITMLRAWERSRAAVVAGWVDTEFPAPLPAWLEAGGFFRRPKWDDGQEMPAAACGNILFDLEQLGDLRFSRELGRSGGEDSLLTRQIKAKGGKVIFCRDSVCIDQLTLDRMTPRWVLMRAMSHGNTAVVIDLHLSPRPALTRVEALGSGLARVVVGGGRWGLGKARKDLVSEARGARLVARGSGMLLGSLGLTYQEYEAGRPLWQRFTRTPEALAAGRSQIQSFERNRA